MPKSWESSLIEPLHPFGLKITSKNQDPIQVIPHAKILEWVQTHKLILLRGFAESSRDDFLIYCQGFPEKKLLEWDFGPVMEMKEMPDPKNYLFSSERVPFHWDGAFHQVPHYLMFQCVQAPSNKTGGETLFSNTQKIWHEATAHEKHQWANICLTYETLKLAHYGGKITGKLVQDYPGNNDELPVLRFAEAVSTELNPVTLTVEGVPDGFETRFIQEMTQKIYHSQFCYSHSWKRGDVMIADNYALIHGRNAFTQNEARHLRRIQVL